MQKRRSHKGWEVVVISGCGACRGLGARKAPTKKTLVLGRVHLFYEALGTLDAPHPKSAPSPTPRQVLNLVKDQKDSSIRERFITHLVTYVTSGGGGGGGGRAI